MRRITCRSCRWARWQRNQDGNIRYSVPGECTFPLNLEEVRQRMIRQLPACVSVPAGLQTATSLYKHEIWARNMVDCMLYEPEDRWKLDVAAIQEAARREKEKT